MSAGDLWFYFWTLSFVVAGASFALIAAIVLVRGVGDLRDMIEFLSRHRDQ